MMWRCHIRREPWADRTKIYLTDSDRLDGSVVAIEPIVQTVVDRRADGLLPEREPTAEFDGDGKPFLQAILDAAWAYGIRPTEHAGSVEAQRLHLDDMRAIAFHKIGADLPGKKG